MFHTQQKWNPTKTPCLLGSIFDHGASQIGAVKLGKHFLSLSLPDTHAIRDV